LTPEKTQDTEPPKKLKENLIRMDLLEVKKKSTSILGRNIFAIGKVEVVNDVTPKNVTDQNLENVERSSHSQIPSAISSLDLRYLGYVLSHQKIVGLIVFRGEALAVMEGDLIAEGFTVSGISPDEIEVLGPDREPMMFSIEGEFP
jgi:hypothetical protein